MPLPFTFDFKNPDYLEVFKYRADNLNRLRQAPHLLPFLKTHYKNNPVQFIIDWGCTADPRNVERNLPAIVPFLPFPKQEEWLYWFLERWKRQEPGVTEKSRELGVTWLSVAISATLCLFNPGLVIGFGSRKEEYVDRLADPKCIFFKIRQFLSLLPVEFRGGWTQRHAPHMRVTIPDTQAVIIGEAGVGIGRGARTGIYIIDEAAHLERPQLTEMSLSETTNCRHDISTPKGMGNPFAKKVHAGKIPRFTFHWRDDPRKDQAWYDKKCRDIDDPVVIAQELDLDYHASVAGVLIPSKWVQAAIDAHVRLGIDVSGVKMGGLDVADEGPDQNAYVGRHGILVNHSESWSGGGSDVARTTYRAAGLAEWHGHSIIRFDSDGLGIGVRGTAREINEKREADRKPPIIFVPFRGSSGVISPKSLTLGKANKDLFANLNSQAWYMLRQRFKLTYEMLNDSAKHNPDDLISIASSLPNLQLLMSEISQVTYSYNNAGKMIINKKPEGARSPDMADALKIAFAPYAQGLYSD